MHGYAISYNTAVFYLVVNIKDILCALHAFDFTTSNIQLYSLSTRPSPRLSGASVDFKCDF